MHVAQPWDVLPPVTPDLRGRTVVVLHAHPDDEAIFTGVTMHRLAAAGARVVLLMATGGERGELLGDLAPGETVRSRRLGELEVAASLLGVHRVLTLGFTDSGDEGTTTDPHALVRANVEATSRLVAGLVLQHNADALIHYDSDGIYGHPDHLAVHAIGARAAELAQVTSYEATVDREHLHLAGPHLVHSAGGHGLVGRTSLEISTAVAGDLFALGAKRKAMLAHASQITPQSLAHDSFDDVYGREWFVRRGAPGILEALGNEHITALVGAR